MHYVFHDPSPRTMRCRKVERTGVIRERKVSSTELHCETAPNRGHNVTPKSTAGWNGTKSLIYTTCPTDEMRLGLPSLLNQRRARAPGVFEEERVEIHEQREIDTEDRP